MADWVLLQIANPLRTGEITTATIVMLSASEATAPLHLLARRECCGLHAYAKKEFLFARTTANYFSNNSDTYKISLFTIQPIGLNTRF